MTEEELLFFQATPEMLPVYEKLRERLEAAYPKSFFTGLTPFYFHKLFCAHKVALSIKILIRRLNLCQGMNLYIAWATPSCSLSAVT